MGLSIYVSGVLVVVLVGLVAYLLADKGIHRKAARDERQFKAAKAAGVADTLKLLKFGDLLRWYGVGSIKNTLAAVAELFNEYCQDPRGPYRLARDVFMAAWSMLRNDPEFGPACREHVISEAMGFEISDETDVDIIKATDRAERIGWPTIAAAGDAWAKRKWVKFTAAIRALFDEFMQPDGEVKIAMRVARSTANILWDSKVEGARALIESIVTEKAKALGWTPPSEAKAAAAKPVA